MREAVIALYFATALRATTVTWTGPPTIDPGQCMGCQSFTPEAGVDEGSGAYLTASYFNDALFLGGTTTQDFSVPFTVSADANIEIDATLSVSASFSCNPAGCTGKRKRDSWVREL